MRGRFHLRFTKIVFIPLGPHAATAADLSFEIRFINAHSVAGKQFRRSLALALKVSCTVFFFFYLSRIACISSLVIRFIWLPPRRHFQTAYLSFILLNFNSSLFYRQHSSEWRSDCYESNVLRYSENWWCENQGERKTERSFPYLNYAKQYCILQLKKFLYCRWQVFVRTCTQFL